MARLLFASHHPALTTGYGRVTRAFADAVAAGGHEATVIGSAPMTIPEHHPAMHNVGYRVLPVQPGALVDAIGRLATSAGTFDLLITIGDPWMFEGLDNPAARPIRQWLACFPLDGAPIPRDWVRWIAAVDERIVFSRFAQRLVSQAIGLEPRVLYHGVDAHTFRPMDKAIAKRRVVGDEQKFVVGCVAANQQRKNLPALVRAFAVFARDKPDALLYLHSPVDGYWDLQALAEHANVADLTRATLGYDPYRGVPDETLATIYNSFDVMALPTMGEGFGLPLLEAQACGVPTLATNCSACPELLADPFQRLEVKATLVMARNVEQAVVDEADLTAKLNHVYADPGLRRMLGETGRQFAETLDWRSIKVEFVGNVTRLLR